MLFTVVGIVLHDGQDQILTMSSSFSPTHGGCTQCWQIWHCTGPSFCPWDLFRACDPGPWNLHPSTQSFDIFCEHSALVETVVSSDCVGVLICVDVIGSKVVSNRFCDASSITVSSSWRSPPVSITLGRFCHGMVTDRLGHLAIWSIRVDYDQGGVVDFSAHNSLLCWKHCVSGKSACRESSIDNHCELLVGLSVYSCVTAVVERGLVVVTATAHNRHTRAER